jgi:glycosyltransferase involved in cell wall biosynthesis
MIGGLPTVDVNLLVYNSADTIAAAIESVLAQTWAARTLTVIDNGSTDGTVEVVRHYQEHEPSLRLHRARINGGGVVNLQRAFMLGDADFVMPKTADDLIAPDFIEKAMEVLDRHPDCAMCHAGGLVFVGDGAVRQVYPEVHRLHAVGPDPSDRARHVMARYTSAPSFWGVFRRSAVDRLSHFRYRAGWDHAVLAELALYGEIRHVPETLYFRRDGGKPVDRIAQASTEAAQRGHDFREDATDLCWMTPLMTTAFTHVETFAVARLPLADRMALMEDAARIFRARWLPLMRREADLYHAARPGLVAEAETAEGLRQVWLSRRIAEVDAVVAAILPDAAIRPRLTSGVVAA